MNQLPQIDSHLTAKLYVDNAISDAIDEPSLLKFIPDEKLTQSSKSPSSSLTSLRTVIELPAKNYVDNKFNDPSIIENTDHVDFSDKNLDNADCIKVISIPTPEEHPTPKIYIGNALSDIISYVDKLHETDRNRRGLSTVFNHQDNEFDNNKLTNLDFVTVNRNPSSDNELANKKYVDESLGSGNILGFNETLQN